MAISSILTKSFDLYRTSKSESEYLHNCHITFQQPIYDLLASRYLEKLRTWWDRYTLPMVSETNKAIFIYETRKHTNVEFLIYNLSYFAREYSLIIFCSVENHSFITAILKHNKLRCIVNIVREDEGDASVRDEYNKFAKSAEFWNSVPFEYVLMTEIDTYLRKPLPEELTNYDYVCCEWPWNKTLSGGGGLSFRKVSSMKRILTECPTLQEISAHDCWVAAGCEKLQLHCNNTMFVEANHMIKDPIGFHQWWTFLHPSTLMSLLPLYESFVTLDI